MENLGNYLEQLHGRVARENLTKELVEKIVESEIPAELQRNLLAEYFGHGPLEKFFADENVTEILVNSAQDIWVERFGRLEKTEASFLSASSLDRYARRLLLSCGRRVDRKNPFADARLADGSRLCAVIEPAVRDGMHLAIRKFQRERQSLAALEAGGSFSRKARNLLEGFVREGKNIFISGGTGSGKTTLLNALASIVPAEERIITLEDITELQIAHPHVVQLEARPPNAEGEGEIDIRSLLCRALRLRPDRLIMGECRGKEALDLLQALNTGHRGSMGTIHANSAREALARLEMLSLMEARNLNPESIRQYIVSAVHVIVHLERKDGFRLVQSIHELRGVQEGVYLLRACEL
jgi:pilus assembly protein CpaF